MTDNQNTDTQRTDKRQPESLPSERLLFEGLISDTETTPMITPSEVIEHLYCPRFIYFMNCLNIHQHEELRYKVVKGRQLHEDRGSRNRDYLRRRLGCIAKDNSVYVASKGIGVRGIIDEVLHLSDGTLAPLDYKYAEYSEYTFETHKIQSVLYAMLIMDNYNKPVNKGFICYARSGNRVKEIIYNPDDFNQATEIIKEIFSIILRGYFPKKTKRRNKCIDCCYRNICV